MGRQIVVVEPGQAPAVRTIGDFDDVRKIVGAHIGLQRMGQLDYLYDEDAAAKGLAPNREINGMMITGTFVVTKLVPGDVASLSETEVSRVLRDLQG